MRKPRRPTKQRKRPLLDWRAARGDITVSLLLGLAFLLIYGLTAAPSVATVFDDSLEFQVVAYTLGIAHPTGYPLYTLLGWLATRLPWAEPAQAVNLMSALFGAATVVGAYLVARRLRCRRLPSVAGTVAVGLTPVLWSQSTIAEVYTLHTALMTAILALTLWTGERRPLHRLRVRRVYPVAVAFGLSLTHHRMAFLLLPPLMAYLWWTFAGHFRAQHWLRIIVLALLPLILYAYLPLRGVFTSSLDGTYVNSPGGFLRHISAASYNVFLSGQAPGIAARGPLDYLAFFLEQLGPVMPLVALLGLGALIRRRGPAILLGLSLLLNLVFALFYRVADFEVFFLPTFVLLGILAALGLDAVATWLAACRGRWGGLTRAGGIVLTVAFLAVTLYPLPIRWLEQDRSSTWAVHRLGQSWMSTPPPGSAVVGILGETTLMRYFQVVHAIGPDVDLIAADDEVLRLQTVRWLGDRGRATYITRPLSGVPDTLTLDAADQLIRVSAPDDPVPAEGALEITPGLRLLGWQWTVLEDHERSALGLALRWVAPGRLTERLKVSARLSRDGRVVAAVDGEPVHNAYPTTAWRPGELVEDFYRIDMPVGDRGGPVDVSLVVYAAESGEARGAADLGTATVPPSPGERPLEEWNLRPAAAWLADGTRLLGASTAGTTQVRAGETLPVSLLWQAGFGGSSSRAVTLELLRGVEVVASVPLGSIGASGVTRQTATLTVPARLESGDYRLQLSSDSPLLHWGWPVVSRTLGLGVLEVQGRVRLLERPRPGHEVDAVFRSSQGEAARLIGYDLDTDEHLHVTLYWQALGEPERRYKVFVHCLDAAGGGLAQSDAEPDGGRASTDSWLRGEYVIDRHVLDLPDEGCAQLLVGLYDDKGVRLLVEADRLVLGGNAVALTENRP